MSELKIVVAMEQFNGIIYVATQDGVYSLEDGVLKRVPFQDELPVLPAPKTLPKGQKNAKG